MPWPLQTLGDVDSIPKQSGILQFPVYPLLQKQVSGRMHIPDEEQTRGLVAGIPKHDTTEQELPVYPGLQVQISGALQNPFPEQTSD